LITNKISSPSKFQQASIKLQGLHLLITPSPEQPSSRQAPARHTLRTTLLHTTHTQHTLPAAFIRTLRRSLFITRTEANDTMTDVYQRSAKRPTEPLAFSSPDPLRADHEVQQTTGHHSLSRPRPRPQHTPHHADLRTGHAGPSPAGAVR